MLLPNTTYARYGDPLSDSSFEQVGDILEDIFAPKELRISVKWYKKVLFYFTYISLTSCKACVEWC